MHEKTDEKSLQSFFSFFISFSTAYFVLLIRLLHSTEDSVHLSRMLRRTVLKLNLKHNPLFTNSCYKVRFNSTKNDPNISIEDPDIHFDSDQPMSNNATQLQFAHRATGETFGQLVNEANNDRNPLHNTRVISPEEALIGVDPRYRDEDTGELLEGATSKEARLDPETLWGRINQKRVLIPENLSQVIEKNILFQYEPKNLKQSLVEWYTTMNEKGIREIPTTEISTDVSIAASFAQDYAVSYQVIDELVKRIGKENFEKNIQSVLDVGIGPSTGMLALNDIMGDEWNPPRKDVFIATNFHMARKAKILLSRQVNENLPRSSEAETQEVELLNNVTKEGKEKKENAMVGKGEEAKKDPKVDEEEEEEADDDGEPYVGRVKTKALKIKSIILDKLRPKDIKYDLILVSYQLLKSLENFPFEVDSRLEEYVKRLNPGGHLVLIERGTPIGAEVIARARQVILRPEKYENQVDKFPRPFKSSEKKMSAKDELKLARLTPEEKALAMKDIEPELLENFDIVEEEEELANLKALDEQIDLSVIAPCSHHGKCPLQFFEPEVYLYGQIGKKLKFCNYTVDVQRPHYLLELKRGKKLATKWESSSRGSAHNSIKGGRGREGSNDFETASYSYLMVVRSTEDPKILEEERQKKLLGEIIERPIGYRTEKREEYPRILSQPSKKKGFVIMDVCAPSGHVEKLHVSKSVGKTEYHDARKANMGDLWALGYKSAYQSTKENTFYFEKIEKKKENLRKQKKRDATKLKRKIAKDYKEALEVDTEEEIEDNITRMAKIDAYEFLTKPKEMEKIKDKRRFKF